MIFFQGDVHRNVALLRTGTILEACSAILGLLGTFRMARRYAPAFFRSMLFALAWPFLYILGQGRRSREFFQARGGLNPDSKDSPFDMALGLDLLCWAFVLQLVSIVIKEIAH